MAKKESHHTPSSVVETGEGHTYLKGRKLGTSKTHKPEEACLSCQITGPDLWSQEQMKVAQMLSHNGRFLSKALPRAKRTSGHYAALFLADEGTPQQGRFYWPGLAAFAAKQVVDGIEYADKNISHFVAHVRYMAAISIYYLIKGNLWVFLEVTPWKTFYKRYGAEKFFSYINDRDVRTYDKPVKEFVQRLPWASGPNNALIKSLGERVKAFDAIRSKYQDLTIVDHDGTLKEMDNLKVTSYLKAAFELMHQYEKEKNTSKKANLNRKAALTFLMHEQTLHLQSMIYDHPDFQFAWDNNDLGREIEKTVNEKQAIVHMATGARDPDLIFNAAPAITKEIERDQLKPAGLNPDQVSVKMKLEDGKLYETEARMIYVERIVDQYHFLMQSKHRAYMIDQLKTMEKWKDAT